MRGSKSVMSVGTAIGLIFLAILFTRYPGIYQNSISWFAHSLRQVPVHPHQMFPSVRTTTVRR